MSNIVEVVEELEAFLCVDSSYMQSSMPIESIIREIRERMSKVHMIDFKRMSLRACKVQGEESLIPSLNRFIQTTDHSYAKLCSVSHQIRYTKAYDTVLLSNVKYLGFNSVELVTSLGLLLSESTIASFKESIAAIAARYNSINVSLEKRLLLLLLVCYDLEIFNVVSIIAELFYQGGRIYDNTNE